MNLYEQTQMGDDSEQISMTVEEYQEYRASCEHVIKQSEMAERLSKNPEFISLIMEDYFTREPHRLGGLMASGRLNENQFQECVKDLRGIAHLRTFLSTFIQKGNIARQELVNLEEARKEIEEENASIMN